jgi:hypothetical protein
MRAAAAVALSLLALRAPAQEIEGRSLDAWRDFIAPKAEELSWESIPWRATLWGALREAQEQDLPVLLWAMNGHPLGCT